MADEKGVGLKGWLSGPSRKTPIHQPEVEKLVPSDRHRIAVLPFANMSPDPNDDYFADGLTEEVISTLSRIQDIEVISRTSAMHYKKNPKTIKEISEDLDVGTVLEGSVRKAGNRLRINIQMIDPNKDRHLWVESFDRELQDIFAIQTEVANNVVRALTIKPSQSDSARFQKKPSTNADAYTLYLKGRYFWNMRGLDQIKLAMDCFERALIKDPKFAPTYVGLADCLQNLSGQWRIDFEANHQKAKTLVDKALQLDTDLAEAHATKARLLASEYRLKEAEEEYVKALALNPSYAPAHLWYFHLLLAQLRWNEALSHIEKAVELDPFSAIITGNYATYYFQKKDYRTALDLSKRAVELDPNSALAHFGAGRGYGILKMFDDASREYAVAVELVRKTYPFVGKAADAWLAFWRNDQEQLRRLLPELEPHAHEAFLVSSGLAMMYFLLGEDGKGFDWLERGVQDREFFILLIRTLDGIPDRVKTDPRYSNVLKKLGLN